MTAAAINLGSKFQPVTSGRASAEPKTGEREGEIILLCSRSSLSSEHRARVAELLSESICTEHLMQLAHRNGVLAFVGNNLLEHFEAELPLGLKEKLAEYCHQHALRNIFLTGKLVEVIKSFHNSGIQCVPFKGPTLALRAYKTLAQRQFIDLDILVFPKDFERAVQLLLNNGHSILESSPPRKTFGIFINRKKDISLTNHDGVRVELHWKLSGSYFGMPLQLRELWGRMDKTNLAGLQINTLPFNDLFVYLCLHAARHGFERLEWLCDLNELINSEKEIEWEAIMHHAKRHGCERAVALAMLLIVDLFGTRPPYPGLRSIESDRALMRAVKRVRERLLASKPDVSRLGDWYEYHLMLKEKLRDRIKLHLFYLTWYVKLIFRPNLADQKAFALPAMFYPLYYILRPARLLLTYLNRSPSKR